MWSRYESWVRISYRSLLRTAVVMAWGSAVLLVSNASASGCPNEALRSELGSGQLPDCRAYELVSPVYKQGAFVSPFAVSVDGARIIAGSAGAFGGAESDGLGQGTNLLGATYEFTRGEGGGWTAAALTPVSSAFRSNGFFDASADLSGTLWELGKRRTSAVGAPEEETHCPTRPGEEEAQPEGITDFYVERPVGTFTKVGPPTPPCTVNHADYTYLGASEDLSHILFSANPEVRWSFDGTRSNGQTLYEYTGVEQPGETREPLLVGVEGGLGSRGLISRCGTLLGSTSPETRRPASAYNAISASGARVFFAAVGVDEAGGCEGPQVGELFAREELSSGELHTVPISEPTLSYCAGAPSPPCGDANFEGASRDGSKVFFTSTQRLPEVSGASEDASGDSATSGCSLTTSAGGCNLYEYEFEAGGAHRLVLVSSGDSEPEGARVQGVARISEDGTHVYFVAKGILTGATENGVGNSAVAGEDNLYLYERDERFPAGRLAFIATLAAPSDASDWSRIDARPVLTSEDGHFLVFTSKADLTDETVKGAKDQVFQYDAVTGALVRASIGENDYNNDGRIPAVGSEIQNIFPNGYGYAERDSPATINGAEAPADGAVFFSSPEGLTTHSLNDQLNFLGEPARNIYEYSSGHVYLLSDGQDASAVNAGPGVQLAGSDPSGADVYFFTSDPLIPGDLDTQQDLYDARVKGGFPASRTPSGCGGEACLGTLTASPVLAALGGSATQAAEVGGSPAASSPARTKPKPLTKKKTKRKKSKTKAGRKARRAGLHGRGAGLHGQRHGYVR